MLPRALARAQWLPGNDCYGLWPPIELELISEKGEVAPHGGKTMGRLLRRGPWVANQYFLGYGSGQFPQRNDLS